MSRQRAAWGVGKEKQPAPQRMRPRGTPGGSFPEGWEFFRPANQPLWFAREQATMTDNGQREWRVCGLLPCKVPLDAEFDDKRRHRREIHSMLESKNTSEVEDLDGGSVDTSSSLTAKERSRSSKRRYFAAWPANEIPTILGTTWTGNEAKTSPVKKSNIVLVMNLCATERYYEKNDFVSQNIDYRWLKIEGGGKVPTLPELRELRQLFSERWESAGVIVRAKDEADLSAKVKERIIEMPIILIHCTHGVNRTGFCSVVLAMLHSKRLEVQEALSLFGVARGHHINRAELREGLLAMFDNDDEFEREDGIVFVTDE